MDVSKAAMTEWISKDMVNHLKLGGFCLTKFVGNASAIEKN